MAKCYYCKDEVTNDDLTEIDGALVRVCADCQDFIKQFCKEALEECLYSEKSVKEMKEEYRNGTVGYSEALDNLMIEYENLAPTILNFDKKVPNSYNNSKTK